LWNRKIDRRYILSALQTCVFDPIPEMKLATLNVLLLNIPSFGAVDLSKYVFPLVSVLIFDENEQIRNKTKSLLKGIVNYMLTHTNKLDDQVDTIEPYYPKSSLSKINFTEELQGSGPKIILNLEKDLEGINFDV
jgi:hypothetical protein